MSTWSKPKTERGGALLTVLWLSAALTAIAFTIATSVRGETERASTHIEQTRAYFLATGALDRALLWMEWGPGHKLPDGRPRFYEYGMPLMNMAFPTGMATVELIPESSKLNVNRATPMELSRLFSSMGVPPERVQVLVESIVDWRTATPGSPLDAFYQSLGPTFRPRHASLEQIEELLYVRGVTPDLYHGTWARNQAGVLTRLPGLKDCLTVYGFNSAYDINATPYPVMVAAGIPADVAGAVVQRRTMRPFYRQDEAAPFMGPAMGKLRLGGNSIYTLRSTATLRTPAGQMSDVRRSAALTVKFNNDQKKDPTPYWIVRWYDNAGTN